MGLVDIAIWLTFEGCRFAWNEMVSDVSEDVKNKDVIIYEAWLNADGQPSLTNDEAIQIVSIEERSQALPEPEEVIDWMVPSLFPLQGEVESMFGDFVERQVAWHCKGHSRRKIAFCTTVEALQFWLQTVSITGNHLWLGRTTWNNCNDDLRLFLVERQTYWLQGGVSRLEVTFRTVWGATRLLLGIGIITYENLKIMRPRRQP